MILVFLQVFKQPWPGVMRTVYGNHQRFETTYFKKFPGYYVTGDGNVDVCIDCVRILACMDARVLQGLFLDVQAAAEIKTGITGSQAGSMTC